MDLTQRERRIIRKARGYISAKRHWTTGTFAKDARGTQCEWSKPGAVSFCAVGALRRSAIDVLQCDEERAARAADVIVADFEGTLMLDNGHTSLPVFNDRRGHKEILKLFDQALKS